MQRFIYLIVFVIALLIFKAFFLDSYLKEKEVTETNTSVETVPQEELAPIVDSTENENNISGLRATNKPKMEKEEMPLDKLGDTLTKHISL